MKPLNPWLFLSMAVAVSIFATGCETVDEGDHDDDDHGHHRHGQTTTTTTVEERRVAPVQQQETRVIRTY